MSEQSSTHDIRTTMVVKQVRSETPAVLSLTLVDPSAAAIPHWEPGAHIDLVLPSGTVRQYSLCGDDQDKTSYTIAVRHDTSGRGGSHEIHSTALVGRELTVIGPRNHFGLVPAEAYLLIAGGIGVTAILAMARCLERTGQNWRALYCGHRRDMAFADDLREINSNRALIVATDRTGRPDLRSVIAQLDAGTAVYCCGPPSLIRDVKQHCDQTHQQVTLRVERFTADPTAGSISSVDDCPVEVELAKSAITITVRADQTIRDAVLGAAEHEHNGTMMICVSRARSERLVLDL